MKLSLVIRQWRWEIIEQLLRWGIGEEEKGEGWLKSRLRGLVLMLALAL